MEMAIVAPLLLLLLFGIIEFGLAFRDRLTVSNAAQAAARVATAVGNRDDADYRVLQSVEQTISNLPSGGLGVIEYVEVYLADSNGEPTGGCPGGSCNRYQYTYVDGSGPLCDWTPCPDPDAGFNVNSLNWPPPSRNVEVGNLDVLGVRIVYSHTWVTGGFLPVPAVDCASPPSDCWTDTAIMRMEPQQFGLTNP